MLSAIQKWVDENIEVLAKDPRIIEAVKRNMVEQAQKEGTELFELLAEYVQSNASECRPKGGE